MMASCSCYYLLGRGRRDVNKDVHLIIVGNRGHICNGGQISMTGLGTSNWRCDIHWLEWILSGDHLSLSSHKSVISMKEERRKEWLTHGSSAATSAEVHVSLDQSMTAVVAVAPTSCARHYIDCFVRPGLAMSVGRFA